MKAAIIFITIIAFLANIHDVESKKMTMDQIRNAIKSARKTCASQSGASKELLDNAAQKGEFPPDPKLQCYFKCIMTLSKAMRNDQLRLDVMKTQAELMLPEDLSERIKDTIDKCHPTITSSEPCEAAWQFAKCYYETDSSKKPSTYSQTKPRRRSLGVWQRIQFRETSNAICTNSRTKRHCRRV